MANPTLARKMLTTKDPVGIKTLLEENPQIEQKIGNDYVAMIGLQIHNPALFEALGGEAKLEQLS